MSQSIILITLLLVLLISCVVGRVISVHASEDKVAQVGAVVSDTNALKELEAHFLRSQSVGTLSHTQIIF
jgi:ABC-type molybdate transport system substrate-binding protein